VKYNNIYNLENKTSFVIGGLGLIGLECSIALASLGSKVVIIDNNKKENSIKKINKKYRNNIFIENINVSDLKNFKKNYSKLTKKYKIPHIFLNSSYPRTTDWGKNSFNKINLETFEKNISIHLNSFSWIAKIVADSMKKNKAGSIIQLGSIYGFIGQDTNLYKDLNSSENMTYSIIKGGVINLTRQMASFYGKYNIRINTISPGAIKNINPKDLTNNKIFVNRYVKKTPLNRIGKASDVASSVIFLSSDAASYITGQNLIVDGGLSII